MPRELKDIVKKKRPCPTDMDKILEYQEQMNILLRSEFFFLQRIEREYGTVYQGPTTSYNEAGFSSIPAPSWDIDYLPDIDSILEAAQRAIAGCPVVYPTEIHPEFTNLTEMS